MTDEILELYPQPGVKHPPGGLYLQQLQHVHRSDGLPFIYSNFITSLDGRIALPGEGRTSHQVPPAIANARDWRLFQELASQADLLITSARFFRQTADHEAQAELPVGLSPEFEDLRNRRLAKGLSAQPDVAIFSASLDIPVTELNHYQDRKLLLLTGARADPAKLECLEELAHVQVVLCGREQRVDGSLLRRTLGELSYRYVYAIAGSSVLHTLASGDALDRLYLTTAHRLLGGTEFDTFVWGQELNPASSMELKAMYLDPLAPEGAGQTLAVYDRR